MLDLVHGVRYEQGSRSPTVPRKTIAVFSDRPYHIDDVDGRAARQHPANRGRGGSSAMVTPITPNAVLAPDRGQVVVTDADLKIRYIDHIQSDRNGETLLGTRYLELLPPEQAPEFERALERARRTGETQIYEMFVDPPSGPRRWYSTQISWAEAEAGLTGMVCVRTETTRQRTAERQLEALRRDLVEASHQAGMAEIATGVLHNVGNVLNSVSVSTETLVKELDTSRFHLLGRTVQMLGEHEDHLADFLAHDPKGSKLPVLLRQLNEALITEREALRREADRIGQQLT